ncbi:DUF6732 family protein [Acuticoccus sp.]|uniref:DUF6732 family protein n=1 Tax=Acuticoccus sp. TaxID=1904378 RepID=UPI003B51DB14
MRPVLTTVLAAPSSLVATLAAAHPGHMEEVAGHTHYGEVAAMAAVAVLCGLAIIGFMRLKGR